MNIFEIGKIYKAIVGNNEFTFKVLFRTEKVVKIQDNHEDIYTVRLNTSNACNSEFCIPYGIFEDTPVLFASKAFS